MERNLRKQNKERDFRNQKSRKTGIEHYIIHICSRYRYKPESSDQLWRQF